MTARLAASTRPASSGSRRDPSVDLVARWLAIGLPPRLATYAALAEEVERPLLAADPELRRRAGPVVGR